MHFRGTILLTALIISLYHLPLEGARILVSLPMPFKSQTMALSVLVKELLARGHEVTMITSIPMEQNLANYQEILLDSKLFVLPEDYSFVDLTEMSRFRSIYDRWRIIADWTQAAFASEPLQKLISSSERFDVIMGNFFTHQQSFLALGHRFNAPLIELCPQHLPLYTASFQGNPYTYSYIPDYELSFIEHLSFVERLHNTIWGLYTQLGIIWYTLPKHEKILKEYLHYPGVETRPPLRDMIRNISLVLVGSHHSFHPPRPYAPNIIEIGGFHLKSPAALPSDLQSFMDSASEGVVFVSFGTWIKADMISEEHKRALVSVFKSLKQRVLWKWDNTEACGNSSQILIKKWLPQQSILEHPNCILFLTHGGLHSLIEAIHFGVPLIGVPFMLDQFHNVEYIQQSGIGLKLEYRHLTYNRLQNAVSTILNTPSFYKRVKEQSSILHDQPQTPLERAIYWVEYVIRHKGAHYLKPASVYLPFHQYILLDIIAVITIALTLFSVFLWKIIKFLYSYCAKHKPQESNLRKLLKKRS
ncbi:unnamed protein product [Bemisia tabaci]|uniref:UDP-glucuronosyltransferase n=1 Tax=Bemisia tabaci TaxID=7038 RepID=A0A9P0F097_BEMTA|nr:unnamed protein product [Bemisia tabaci]